MTRAGNRTESTKSRSARAKAVHDRKRAQAWQSMGKMREKDWEVLALVFGFRNVEECQEFAVVQEANRAL